jgi:hypothetical protein
MVAHKIDNGVGRDAQLSGMLEPLGPEGSRFNQLLEAVTTYAEPFRHLASGIGGPNNELGTMVAAVNAAPSGRLADAQLRSDRLERGVLCSGTAEKADHGRIFELRCLKLVPEPESLRMIHNIPPRKLAFYGDARDHRKQFPTRAARAQLLVILWGEMAFLPFR